MKSFNYFILDFCVYIKILINFFNFTHFVFIDQKVLELFNKMRESTKEVLHNQTGQGLQRTRSGSGLETILTYSNQYEVMYVGSIRVSDLYSNTYKWSSNYLIVFKVSFINRFCLNVL